jgi:transcriptional regulator with XRE-family HTH domain
MSKEYSKRLRSLRVANNWSQEQLGFTVGVTQERISQIENGKFTFEIALKILKELECPPTVEEMTDKEFQTLRSSFLIKSMDAHALRCFCDLMERVVVSDGNL